MELSGAISIWNAPIGTTCLPESAARAPMIVAFFRGTGRTPTPVIAIATLVVIRTEKEEVVPPHGAIPPTISLCVHILFTGILSFKITIG